MAVFALILSVFAILIAFWSAYSSYKSRKISQSALSIAAEKYKDDKIKNGFDLASSHGWVKGMEVFLELYPEFKDTKHLKPIITRILAGQFPKSTEEQLIQKLKNKGISIN